MILHYLKGLDLKYQMPVLSILSVLLWLCNSKVTIATTTSKLNGPF